MTSEEIKALRERLKISQGTLARMIGCSQATVYNWEKGTHSPAPMALAALERINLHANTN